MKHCGEQVSPYNASPRLKDHREDGIGLTLTKRGMFLAFTTLSVLMHLFICFAIRPKKTPTYMSPQKSSPHQERLHVPLYKHIGQYCHAPSRPNSQGEVVLKKLAIRLPIQRRKQVHSDELAEILTTIWQEIMASLPHLHGVFSFLFLSPVGCPLPVLPSKGGKGTVITMMKELACYLNFGNGYIQSSYTSKGPPSRLFLPRRLSKISPS